MTLFLPKCRRMVLAMPASGRRVFSTRVAYPMRRLHRVGPLFAFLRSSRFLIADYCYPFFRVEG
jgi:hypothetical protein